jgi:uncharacterized phage protein (TIGR01671 family)
MQSIKFRVWSKEDKEYNSLAFCLDQEGQLFYQGSDYLVRVDPEDHVVEQYIGLEDANDVEIYEGDIVCLFDDPEEFYEVVYDDYDDFPDPCFILDREDGRGAWFRASDRLVVGNVNENPELLK